MDRSEAKKLGLTFYMPTKPCKHGHLSERVTKSGRCRQCAAEYLKRPDVAEHRAAMRKSDECRAKEQARRLTPEWQQYQAAYRARPERVEKERARGSSPEHLARREARRKTPQGLAYDRARSAKRLADQARRTPPWAGELDLMVWQEAHHVAALRELSTGVKWAADHMEPMRARSVSGLHVWNNCQVIPAKINEIKGNRRMLTGPLEWLALL